MLKTIFITSVLFIILSLVGAGIYLFVPLSNQGANVDITFESHTSLSEMATLLEHKKVIPSALGLRLWIKLLGTEKRIQAGRYIFVKHEGTLSVAEKLLHATAQDVCVTIPEGLTVEQIARIFALTLKIDTTRFLTLCRAPETAVDLGISAPTLEGYLFPNTYRFNPLTTEYQILGRMVGQFKKMYSSLPDTFPNAKNFSCHQILTMASIVEKEATLPSERQHISGVFFNRLKIGYPLGADPTVRYIFKRFDGPLYVSQLNSNSPYNTRKFKGLPPGPICCPGKGSILAALAPLPTKDLYFVAKWNGSGAHDFSKTYTEHLQKTLAIRRSNAQKQNP